GMAYEPFSVLAVQAHVQPWLPIKNDLSRYWRADTGRSHCRIEVPVGGTLSNELSHYIPPGSTGHLLPQEKAAVTKDINRARLPVVKRSPRARRYWGGRHKRN